MSIKKLIGIHTYHYNEMITPSMILISKFDILVGLTWEGGVRYQTYISDNIMKKILIKKDGILKN